MADGLSLVLTVEEAGEQLRISRSLAYQLARRFLDTGGREGLPVLKLGRRMVVPRHMFELLLRGEFTFTPAPEPIPRKPSRRPTVSTAAQLSLIPSED